MAKVRVVDILVNAGLAIKMVRLEKDISQTQLGDLVGMDAAKISRIERGQVNITLGTLTKIASALDSSIYALFRLVKLGFVHEGVQYVRGKPPTRKQETEGSEKPNRGARAKSKRPPAPIKPVEADEPVAG